MYTFFTKKINKDNIPNDGSVIFMENTVPRPLDGIMERVTNSPLSHVAILLYYNNEPYIYEAYPPVARKMPFYQYLDEMLPKWEKKGWTKRLGGLNTFWWEYNLSKDNLDIMKEKAEELLGMKYRLLLNFFFNMENAIHCSEYVSYIYEAAGLLISKKGRESPGSLYRKLLQLGV